MLQVFKKRYPNLNASRSMGNEITVKMDFNDAVEKPVIAEESSSNYTIGKRS